MESENEGVGNYGRVTLNVDEIPHDNKDTAYVIHPPLNKIMKKPINSLWDEAT